MPSKKLTEWSFSVVELLLMLIVEYDTHSQSPMLNCCLHTPPLPGISFGLLSMCSSTSIILRSAETKSKMMPVNTPCILKCDNDIKGILLKQLCINNAKVLKNGFGDRRQHQMASGG